MKGEHITTKVIKKYGYEYHLAEVFRPEGLGTSQPCFMGFKNMALVSCNKIAGQPPKTKKK